MSGARHTAIRTCIGCGTRAPQRELLCLGNAPDGSVVVVEGRRRAGRTGYLHARPDCWERFAARKGSVRSLGRSVDKGARKVVVQRLQAAATLVQVR